MYRRRVFLLALCACALAGTGARAYNEAVHAELTGRALASDPRVAQTLQPPSAADLAALRALYWRTARALPDAALRDQFLASFPTEASLDAYAFKEFFMLDPAAAVHGFDAAPDALQPARRGELLQRASRWPDDDERNRHRYLRDARREIVRDPRGQPLPDDPATLEMGSLTGISSQAHAHYGLLPGPLSDDPAVLKKDPRHFAVPADVHTFGADFAELYTDLALLSAASEAPARGFLAATFAGAAYHHSEDMANQIHTVQVGIYEFFEAAFLQSKVRDLVTLGGLFGERRTLRELGLRLVANHHLLSEDLFAKRLAEAARGAPDVVPEVRAALEAIAADDPAFAQAAREAIARSDGAFGRAIAEAMIEASSAEGPEVYRLIWQLSSPALRDGAGHEYDGARDDPDAWVVKDGPARQALLARFYELEGRGLRRAGTALRLWQAHFDAASAQDAGAVRAAAVRRTLQILLPYHRAQAERRARYVPAVPEERRVDLRWAAGALVAAALLALAARALLGRRRLREAAPRAPSPSTGAR